MKNIVSWKKLPDKEAGEIESIEQELDFEDTEQGNEQMINFIMTLEANEGTLVECKSIKTVRPGDLLEASEAVAAT